MKINAYFDIWKHNGTYYYIWVGEKNKRKRNDKKNNIKFKAGHKNRRLSLCPVVVVQGTYCFEIRKAITYKWLQRHVQS